MQTVSIGTQDFEYLREHQFFYIDKTDFIREWWENGDNVTLITRPRRFGKTLNMSMVEKFFSNRYRGREELFEGLSVWNFETYRKLQGTYPVISLSFANIKEKNYQTARDKICILMTELYSKHGFLLKEDLLEPGERDFFQMVSNKMDDSVATLSLYMLSGFLSKYYGKPVIILLDEYDTPLQEAYADGYWDELLVFMRSLFHATFKTNPYMERAILTGITRISKESVFSDLNHLAVITTTTERYATSFGFTEEEVFQALDAFGMPDRKETVKKWYDGFTFGGHRDIYNPWSITSFLKEKKIRTYWANTSENMLVSRLIQTGSADVKIAMEDLLADKLLVTPVDEEIVYDQLERSDTALWSLLLASGYLKVEHLPEDEELEEAAYQMSLTNLEVKRMFRTMVKTWFYSSQNRYRDFIRALLAGDTDFMNQYMGQIAEQMFSFFDVGKNHAQPERFYHGFVLGLIVDLADRYHVTSNRESGLGRYDVMLEPLNAQDPAFILEFKVHRASEKNLAGTVKNALAQIAEKNYDAELIARGISEERIRHYGFAFDGKQVLIG